MKVESIFNIPNAAIANNRIAKKILIPKLNANTREKKLINESISNIYIKGVLDESTSKYKTFSDEIVLYETIIFIEIDLSKSNNIELINSKIHEVFPNPLIILYRFQDEYMLTSATKRLNKVDSTKSIIKEYFSTDFFEDNNQSKKFFENFDKNLISLFNFKELYIMYSQIIYTQRLIKYFEDYPLEIKNISNVINTLHKIDIIEKEIKKLKIKYNDESMMASKMKVHMIIVDKTEELNKYINNLKGDLQYEKNE